MGKCLLRAQCSDLCFVVADRMSLGSATDSNVNNEESALPIQWVWFEYGTRYTPGTQVEPSYPPAVVILGGIPSCKASVVCSLFVHQAGCCRSTAALEGVIPVLASGIAATRLAPAPRDILSTASSTAALLAGLLVFDPSLQLMVLTKENVAAHAVAEHLVSLQLPDHIQGKMGRLVGYHDKQNDDTSTKVSGPSGRNGLNRRVFSQS